MCKVVSVANHKGGVAKTTSVVNIGIGIATVKELSEVLGKETIDIQTTSDTKGQSESTGLNSQRMGKELMSPDEIAILDGSKCILQIRGVRPFLSDKFDITKHKRYKQLSDYDPKNTFNVGEYLSTRLKLKKNEVVDVYDMGVVEETSTGR